MNCSSVLNLNIQLTTVHVLKEVFNYYTNNNTPVFSVFLDISKAFDKVKYCKLFRLLLQRGIPPIILRALLQLYTMNFLRVSWFGVMSDHFRAVNGVKQGAILSPILFCVYIDNLLILLSKSGVGCCMGRHFLGALAYADDIVLLAPSPTAMRKMLHLCESYAYDFNITFNSSKSKCLFVKPLNFRDCNECTFYLDNNAIDNVSSFSHLGHFISADITSLDDNDISSKCATFIRQVNSLLAYFKHLSSTVKFRLFMSYCSSFFGSEIWSLDNKGLDAVSIAWRKSLRRIWQLPNTSHNFLLPLVSGCIPIFDEIVRRSHNFYFSCINSSNILLSFVAKHSLLYGKGYSLLGRNSILFRDSYNLFLNRRCAVIKDSNQYSIDQYITAKVLSNLIEIRDGSMEFSPPGFANNIEINSLIILLCTG